MDLLTPQLGLFAWTLIAFVLVFLILRKFAWKPILGMLGERERGIAESIATAERVKKEMSLMQAENEKLLMEARAERSAMLKEAKEEQERIIAEAKEKTREITEKMMADARQQIEHQKLAAITEVKNEIGTLAVAVAEKILRKQLGSAQEQNELINSLTEDIQLN
jgi:F-type H+-transporting ATPase subunit b